MQLAGVQPAGSKGFASVSVAVTEPQPAKSSFAAPQSTQENGPRVPHALTSEPVVFPREGLPVDQRPAQLRLLKAANRYKESKEWESKEWEPQQQQSPHAQQRRRAG